MRPLRWPVWFCLVWGLIGLGVITIHPAYGVTWCCLWLGLAAFYVGAGRRFPRFRPLPPVAYLGMLGFARDELEGPVVSPWYLLIIVVPIWLCVMMVPVMIPSTSALPFAIPTALALGGGAYWLSRRQRASARVAAVLLGGSTDEVTVATGTIASPPVGLRRQVFWFSITGERRGTTTVEDLNGNPVQVSTVTATSTTYGYRQEERHDLLLESEGGQVLIETSVAQWASPTRILPSAPALRAGKPDSPRQIMLSAYVGSARAWEEEAIGKSSVVLVAGKFDDVRRRISSAGDRPVAIYGVPQGRDPRAELQREWSRRQWPIFGQVALAVIAVAVALLVPPPQAPPTELRAAPLPVQPSP